MDSKLHSMLQGNNLLYCRVPDFLISNRVTQEWDQNSKYWFVMAALSSNIWIWSVSRFFYFRSCGSGMETNVKCQNSEFVIALFLTNLNFELHSMILDRSLDCSILHFTNNNFWDKSVICLRNETKDKRNCILYLLIIDLWIFIFVEW